MSPFVWFLFNIYAAIASGVTPHPPHHATSEPIFVDVIGLLKMILYEVYTTFSRYTNSETISPLSLSISSSYSGYDMVWYIEYTPYTSPCLHPFVWNPVIEFNLSSKNRMKNSENLEHIPPWQWDGPSNMLHMQEGEGAKIGVGQSDESASHPFFGMVMMIGMMMMIIIMKNHDHDNGLIVW